MKSQNIQVHTSRVKDRLEKSAKKNRDQIRPAEDGILLAGLTRFPYTRKLLWGWSPPGNRLFG
jgi:hypothetical protein